MNIDNILSLLHDNSIKDAIRKILEFEQSKLHQSQPVYKDQYRAIIEETLNEDSED